MAAIRRLSIDRMNVGRRRTGADAVHGNGDSLVILVTGATGFIGSRLIQRLSSENGSRVVAAVRRDALAVDSRVRSVVIGDVGTSTDWSAALSGVQCVVHAAARVHIVRDAAIDPLAEYRLTNVAGTVHLARAAAAAGVRRFVFISSVKVNGENTAPGACYSADDVPAPADAYAVSKREAEVGLLKVAAETGMELVIIRPPLVYGPGVKANFLALMRWLRRGIPLPLGAVHNLRSFVALDNLVDFISLCLTHTAAAGQIFLVSDGDDLSTTDLLRRLGMVLDKPARLIPVPTWLLEVTAQSLGKRAQIQRLCGSLRVDISKNRSLLDWSPPISVDEGLRRVAAEFLRETPV